MTPDPKLKIGLALGGGGARGLSHVGALLAFQEAGIPLHAVAGVSIGAVIGGLYASNPDAKILEATLRASEEDPTHQAACRSLSLGQESFCGTGLFSRTYYALKAVWLLTRFALRGSLFSAALHETLLGSILPNTKLENLPLPFGALTIDADTADLQVHTTGNLHDVVLAGSAIPCIFPLRRLDGKLLGDPTAANAVPVSLAREALGCDFVIAIDVGSELLPAGDLSRGHRMALRLTALLSERLNRAELAGADLIIRPNLDAIGWSDFSCLDAPLEQGRIAVEAVLPELRTRLNLPGAEPHRHSEPEGRSSR